MSKILELPLTIQEAAEKSGRCVDTIRRWIASGQLPVLPYRGKGKGKSRVILIDREELILSCTTKRVKYKRPRYPSHFRKRELDKIRWHAKYKNAPNQREYRRNLMRYLRAKRKLQAAKEQGIKNGVN